MSATTAQAAGPLDLVAFARAHGFRVRNLNDGASTPPVWRSTRGRGRPAYKGADDFAIAARHGYVVLDAPGRLGWCLLTTHGKAFKSRLEQIRRAGGVVSQEGEFEAAGWAPREKLDAILAGLGAWRRYTRPTEGILELESTQRGDRAARVHAKAPAAVEPRFTPDGEARGETPDRAISLTTTVR